MPFTDDQRREIRSLLEALVHELEARLPETEDQSRPVDLDEPIGRLSRMDAIQMQQMAAAGLSRERQQLAAALFALSLVEGEDFGRCQACKAEIDIDRLRFQPEVLRCQRCA